MIHLRLSDDKNMKKIIYRWCQMSDPAKATIAFVFSSLILKGINLFTTPLFTRLMDSSEFGVIATYNSWISIIDVFACLGLTSVGVINVGLNQYKNPKERKSYLSSMTGLCNITTIVVFGVVIIIQHKCNHPVNMNSNLITVMFIHLFFNPAQTFWMTAERYDYKYKHAVLVTVLSAFWGTVVSLGAVVFHNSNLGMIKIIYQEIGNACFYLPIYLYVLWNGRRYIDIQLWKKTLLFAIPLIPHYLSQHIMTSADRIMISDMVSSSAAAIYAVVTTINSISLMFWNAINASFMPFTFEKMNEKDDIGLHSIANSIMIGYAIICTFVTLIAPEILLVLGPKEYQAGIYVVPPIVCVSFLTALYNLFSNVEFYYKKSVKIAMASVVAALVNLLLNYLLIPRYGYIAAAYTTMISNCILVLMHYLSYRKIRLYKVYNDTTLSIILFICAFCCLSCNIIYRYTCVRYIAIGGGCIVLLCCRKTIIRLFKYIRG